MAEKLLIINEKPSQYDAFVDALGGQEGIFDGEPYAIVHLQGHILSNGVPDEIALPDYKQKVGKFSNLSGIPWNYRWFDFNNKTVPKKSKYANTLIRYLNDVKSYLNSGYTPVIASDSDKSGEGDLLVREVLIYLNYHGKTYREYHTDETPHYIKKALKERKVVTEEDPRYQVAFTRSNMDYLTQQLTRVSTMNLQKRGYRLPAPVPFGRLKSVMLELVGDQLAAIKKYKPSQVFESRYKLDNLELSKKGMKTYPTKEEWQADGLPETSKVQETKQVSGHTAPPKAYTLDQIMGQLSKKGMKGANFIKTYQKMYEYRDKSSAEQTEKGGFLSYPRTDDNVLTHGQFNEMLPYIDDILNVLELPKSIFTHRQPRNTHVKDKVNGQPVSHGCNRPGKLVPTSLKQLDDIFGPYAGEIYKVTANRFLMMFLEDTEWVRHEYETTDTPEPFKGSIKIITKHGVDNPDEPQETVTDKLPDLNNLAKLYPHAIKSTKPKNPTIDWTTAQLKKVDVGTGATRSATLTQMMGTKPYNPIHEGTKQLTLNPIGEIGYEMAKGTVIGSIDGTKQLNELIEKVRSGEDKATAYDSFTDIIAKDVPKIEQNSTIINLDALKIPKEAPKVTAKGTWQGQEITFNRVFMGHEYTDEEVEKLLNGEEIQFETKNKEGKPAKIKGKLGEQEYKGHKFIGLKAQFVRDDVVKGNWNGNSVAIKNEYQGHKFTDEELKTLFAGNDINLEITNNNQSENISLRLANKELTKVSPSMKPIKTYKYVGFDVLRPGYKRITFEGKPEKIKASFMDYQYSDEDIQKLANGETINITTHKNNNSMNVAISLGHQQFVNDKYILIKYLGVNPVFENDKNKVGGVFKHNGKAESVHFKGEFMKHKFTQDEIDKLLNNETIEFQGTSKDGQERTIKGKLAKQSFKGNKFFGFKPDFKNKK